MISSIQVPGDVGIGAMRDIPNDTDPFIFCNVPKNPEMVYIRESSLHKLPDHVRDHVKKFIIPHVTNDGEKEYPISAIDIYGTSMKFCVKTTSDANQSNCKYTQGPGYTTIKTTRLIETGDELLLFNELPKYDDNKRDDNVRSDLEKKCSGDKRKERELSEDDRREILVLDYDTRQNEVMVAMAKRDVEFWEQQIQQINVKENIILGGGNELSEDDGIEIRLLDMERRLYIGKVDVRTFDFEFYEKLNKENSKRKKIILEGGGRWLDFDHLG